MLERSLVDTSSVLQLIDYVDTCSIIRLAHIYDDADFLMKRKKEGNAVVG